jgi:pimeloyl-ACP methyl ester carboxylesterase
MAPIQPRESTQYWAMQGGYRIAYTRVESAGTRPPIVYLHGGPGGYVHSSTIAELSRLRDLGHDIYLYDQSGSGLSDRRARPKDTTFESHVTDLDEIISHHIRAERVVLIGHSFGGVIAAHYAACHPDRIAALILSSPGDLKPNLYDDQGRWVNEQRYPPPPELRFIDTSATLDHDTSLARLPFRAMASMALAQALNVKFASDREVDAALNTMASQFTRSMVCDPANVQPEEGGAGAYSRIGVNFFPDDFYDPRADMARMNAPVLVLHGQCDTIPYEAVAEYVDLFPNATYRMIEGAGHEQWWDQPDAYEAALREFLVARAVDAERAMASSEAVARQSPPLPGESPSPTPN